MKISLTEWASKRGISQRKAQRLAFDGKIPAEKEKMTKAVIKTWYAYMIESSVKLPNK